MPVSSRWPIEWVSHRNSPEVRFPCHKLSEEGPQICVPGVITRTHCDESRCRGPSRGANPWAGLRDHSQTGRVTTKLPPNRSFDGPVSHLVIGTVRHPISMNSSILSTGNMPLHFVLRFEICSSPLLSPPTTVPPGQVGTEIRVRALDIRKKALRFGQIAGPRLISLLLLADSEGCRHYLLAVFDIICTIQLT